MGSEEEPEGAALALGHKHHMKLTHVGTWTYVWTCQHPGCAVRVSQFKHYFRTLVTGGEW